MKDGLEPTCKSVAKKSIKLSKQSRKLNQNYTYNVDKHRNPQQSRRIHQLHPKTVLVLS